MITDFDDTILSCPFVLSSACCTASSRLSCTVDGEVNIVFHYVSRPDCRAIFLPAARSPRNIRLPESFLERFSFFSFQPAKRGNIILVCCTFFADILSVFFLLLRITLRKARNGLYNNNFIKRFFARLVDVARFKS